MDRHCEVANAVIEEQLRRMLERDRENFLVVAPPELACLERGETICIAPTTALMMKIHLTARLN